VIRSTIDSAAPTSPITRAGSDTRAIVVSMAATVTAIASPMIGNAIPPTLPC
jgi:hypothetical protein